jgi:uncharacterized protein YkwD
MEESKTLITKIVEEHNKIRKNPKSYIPYLEEHMKQFKGDVRYIPGSKVGLQTNEGKAAYEECINFLKKQSPLGELKLDDHLSRASQDHADDIGPKGITGHTGSDGSSADDRISRYLEWDVTIAENIDFGSTKASDIIISLIVDDGVPNRGHRQNIFNPSLKIIGVGLADHTEYEKCSVLNYAGGVSGYKDDNNAKGKQNEKAPKVTNKNEDAPKGTKKNEDNKTSKGVDGKTPSNVDTTLLREIVEEHNKIRKNPKSYIPYLEEHMKQFKGDVRYIPGSKVGLQTNEGKAAYEECINFLKKQSPLGELKLDDHLSRASQDHADDIGPKGITGHTGSDGSSADDRISRYLEWDVTIAENIDFGSTQASDIIISLIVDDGVPNRGHRQNIFNPSLKIIGVGLADHTEYEKCSVLNYAGGVSGYKDYNNAKGKQNEKAPKVTNKNEDAPKGTKKNEDNKTFKGVDGKTPSNVDTTLLREIVEEHNKIRKNPKSYIPYLEEHMKQFKGDVRYIPGSKVGLQTNEGKAAYEECINFLKKQSPLGELKLDDHLSRASQDHADDIGPKGITGHTGSDGSSADDRISRYLEWDVTIAENIDFGSTQASDIIISLIVDDGVPNRGHRQNIFNPSLKIIGVGLADHTEYEKCSVLNYAGGVSGYKDYNNAKGTQNEKAPKVTNKNEDNKTSKGVDGKTQSKFEESKTLISEIVEEHNKIRKNPKSYIPFLEEHMKQFKGDVRYIPGSKVGLQTNEGKAAYEECINFLKKQSPLGELKLDDHLSRASQDHADDIGPKGITGHTGSDGSSADDRISRYLEWDVTIAENIDFGSTKASDIIISLIVDDGVPNRGHRQNIFNPSLKIIGVGLADHTEYEKCTVLNYAGGVSGYKDDNNVKGKQNDNAPKGTKNNDDNKTAKVNDAKTPSNVDTTLIREIVEEHNKIRKNPKSYIPFLEEHMKQFKGDVRYIPGSKVGLQTNEGKAAYEECINFLKKQSPLGELKLDDHLSRASQDHADDIGPKGITGHTGSDGSSVDDRISRHLEWDVTIAENIDFGSTKASDIIISLIVDDGVPNRGHRQNIFNPSLKIIGVGLADHIEYEKCTVLNYAGGVSGYKDDNNVKGKQNDNAPKGTKKNEDVPKGTKKNEDAPKGTKNNDDKKTAKVNDGKTPSNVDKILISEIVEEHNKIRKNPKSYIPHLEDHMKQFKGDVRYIPGSKVGLQTIEGKAAYEECINFLKKQSPLGGLKLDNELSKASQDHADDIGPKGITEHTGSDGSSVDDRISRYVDWDVTIAENIDFGSTKASDVIVSLIVDDGVTSRGHRQNIFNPSLKIIGVGLADHTTFGNCMVINYTGGINRYVDENERKLREDKNYDPDAPEGTVKTDVNVTTKVVDGHTQTITVKKYTLNDGSQQILEICETHG